MGCEKLIPILQSVDFKDLLFIIKFRSPCVFGVRAKTRARVNARVPETARVLARAVKMH